MTTTLFYLTLTAGLGVILWIPHAIGMVKFGGDLSIAEAYREAPNNYDKWPAWIRRANRVHINFVENFAPFAVLVIVAHLAIKPDAMGAVALWAQVFFWARVAHAIVYWAGWPYVRTLTFIAGVVAQAALFVVVAGEI